MPYNKASVNAGKHPYLRREFEWPIVEDSPPSLGPMLSEQELEEIIDKARKERTFYLNSHLTTYFQVGYYKEGEVLNVTKQQLMNDKFVQNHWDEDHKQRWENLREEPNEQVRLVNNGTSWWTAETLWIKARLLR